MILPPNFMDCEQRSAPWFEARIGCVTASRVADAISKLKNGGESAARRNYKYQLLFEVLTGRVAENYVTPAMEFGLENEPLARTAYELATDRTVEIVGLVYHPRIKMAAASPDGLVGKDGLIEIKVPTTATHLDYLINEEIPEEYELQMLWQMACTERDWCDFISYDPRLPEDLQMFMSRFPRDEKRIREMEREVGLFLSEVEALVSKLKSRNSAEAKLYV